MNNKNAKISVIIPVYNVGKYLRHCLDSVINQSLKDIEIVCVEDCSTDNSAEILREYAEKDSRIKCIFHEKNKGCVITRKDGVENTTGEYILFLDSDDFLAGNACQKLYKAIKEKDVDILQFGSTVVPTDGVDEISVNGVQQILTPHCEHISATYTGEITNACYYDRKFGFTLWNKLLNGDITRHAFTYCMEEWLNLGDDSYVFFMISFFAKSFCGIPDKYHFYRFGAGMTGGIKNVTDYQFAQKNKRGLFIRKLKDFCARFDPANRVEPALDMLERIFIQDINSNMMFYGDIADKSAVLREELTLYTKSKVISELFYSFQFMSWDKQRHFLNTLDPQKLFSNKTEAVKTLGVFYYRINNGGVERVLSILLDEWLKAGYKVILFTDEVPCSQDYDYPDEVIRVILPKMDSMDKKTIEDRAEYLQYAMKQYSVDMMIYHAWASHTLLTDMFAVKSLDIPFVVNNHGYLYFDLGCMYVNEAHHNLLIPTICKFYDANLVLSEVDYQWLKLKYNHIYKILNPLTFDLKNVQSADISKSKELLWVGRISKEKNLIGALNILKCILDKGYETKLNVVGEAYAPEYHKVIVDEINRLNLQEHVVLHGFNADVTPFYKKAGVLLMTSEYEGFSMVIAESKAYGVPTVMYDLPNLEFVRDGRGLITVPQNNTQMAAEAIIKLLEDDAMRVSLGKEARQSILDMYSMDIGERWKNIIDDVIATKDAERENKSALSTAVDMLTDFVDRGMEERKLDLQYWINKANEQAPYVPTAEDSKEKVLEMYRNGDIGFKYIGKYFRAWLKHKFTGGRK